MHLDRRRIAIKAFFESVFRTFLRCRHIAISKTSSQLKLSAGVEVQIVKLWQVHGFNKCDKKVAVGNSLLSILNSATKGMLKCTIFKLKTRGAICPIMQGSRELPVSFRTAARKPASLLR